MTVPFKIAFHGMAQDYTMRNSFIENYLDQCSNLCTWPQIDMAPPRKFDVHILLLVDGVMFIFDGNAWNAWKSLVPPGLLPIQIFRWRRDCSGIAGPVYSAIGKGFIRQRVRHGDCGRGQWWWWSYSLDGTWISTKWRTKSPLKMQETSWDKARCRKTRLMPQGERLTFEKHSFVILILNCEIVNYVQDTYLRA